MRGKIGKLLGIVTEFGPIFSAKYCFYKYTQKDEKYIKLTYEYLYDVLKPLIEEYKGKKDLPIENLSNHNTKVPVWVCWWQGYDNMPDLCKMCYHRLEKMLPENTELHLITLENYKNYVHIPSDLLGRFESGTITMTTYSDVLRNYLLKEHGGLWIDSTVFVSNRISKEFFEQNNWWSVKLPFEGEKVTNLGQKISKRKWASFLQMGYKGNLLNSFVADAFEVYYRTHRTAVDYFMQNMMIAIAYDHLDQIREIVDRVEFNNKDVYSLYDHIDEPFDKEKYDNWNKNTYFYKMTWKRKYCECTEDGVKNFYSHFVDECMG